MSELRELEPNEPKDLQDGRYVLENVIGEGSMGRTYLALDTTTNTQVAIKALFPSRLATLKDLELFEREATILERLDHPFIPKYIDSFHEGDGEAMQYFLVQTYIAGDTLQEVLRTQKRFEEHQIVQFAESLLQHVDYLHQQDPKVVHRDLKPGNIIVDDDFEPYFVDFGAVREVVRLTMGGGSTIIGTYGYMPPEQLMGKALPASDLYSIGIVLLEMLTRKTPEDLSGNSTQKLIAQANMSDEFRRLLSRLCAPSLVERYPDASACLSDLEALKSGGNLVHAGKIEVDIERSARERAEELARATGRSFAFIVYLTLGAFVFGGLIFVMWIFASTLAMANTTLVFASIVSALGLLTTIVMVGQRTKHDSWEPPKSDWKRAIGTLQDVQRKRYDPNGNETLYNQFEYSFSVNNQTFSAAIENKEDFAGMDEVVVFYKPGSPTIHEVCIGTDSQFDPSRTHTPE